MSTVNVAPATEPGVVLDPDQAERLRHLIGTVEDWLLHCGDEALDDLAGFLTGLGRASSFASRERLVDDLVNDLGEHAVALRTALRHAGIGAGPAA
ncbi:hypothetical protein [Pseudonocardia kunmingensis]|uniref:Uncharacterized protein n=1 Tax=Pseudonocardia kunmingensis TaxID=630975 RepID=A0A543DNY8_9PSEU|nr:hypothetical protein [Pseudonocardia kunmingensis]TQM11046.1 hypothetical protein FB558_3582 [Pseudonocardia kunmingensis]